MIILKVEKQNMFQNSSLKPILLFIAFFFLCFWSHAQQKKKRAFEFQKFGIQLNRVTQDFSFVDDPDYNMTGITLKSQWFFHMRKLGKWDFNVILQPQFQSLQHQLVNKFFVQEVDYPGNVIAFRDRFTKQRTMSFFAFELGFQLRRSFTQQLHFEFTAGLGAGYIDSETERLALGFTFVENLSFGLAKTFDTSELYLGFNLNHISNLDIQLPNSGYDLLGWEVSYRFLK